MKANRSLKTVREEQCPECFAQCWFCSDYIWMVRSLHCGAQGRGPKGSSKEPCPKSIPEKGKTCGTCGKKADQQCEHGGGRVMVERQIVGSNLK